MTVGKSAAHMLAIASRRIGMAGYAAILSSLRAGPASTTELVEKHGVSRVLVLHIMRHCLRVGIVHRQDWFRPAPHARMVPRWALGADGDVSMPEYEERARKPRRAPSTLMLLTTTLQLLAEHPHGRAELAQALCMHIESAARVITTLRKAGLIHIACWEKPAVGCPWPEFSAGSKPDARRPPPARNNASAHAAFRTRRAQLATLQALAGRPYVPMAPAAPRAASTEAAAA